MGFARELPLKSKEFLKVYNCTTDKLSKGKKPKNNWMEKEEKATKRQRDRKTMKVS